MVGTMNKDTTALPVQIEIDALIALYRQGRLADVLQQGEALAHQHPQTPILFNILGAANAGLKRPEAALQCFERALLLSPGSAEAHNNLGNALKSLRRFDEALASYKKALAIQPDAPSIHNNLGHAHNALGHRDDAIASYERAIKLKPGYVEAWYNLGSTLRAVGRREDAIAILTRAIQLKPDYAEAHSSLGHAFSELGRYEEAATCYRKAIELKPALPEAHHQLGNVLKEMGRRDEAIGCYERALALRPSFAAARAQKLHQHAHNCDWEAIAADAALIQDLGLTGDIVPPFIMLRFDDCPERQQIRAQRYSSKIYRQSNRHHFARPDSRPERLRIGYFSCDFHNHATMSLMARLFELHDRDRFEILGYSYGPNRDDELRRRAVAAFDRFVDIRTMSDAAVAELARRDGVDIAIDVNGYTQNGRLGIFAQGAAPLQMSYLGFAGTLGVPFIDYQIADKQVIPDAQRRYYSEKLIYLPNSYQVNDDKRVISQQLMSRAEMGLPEKAFVFCNFGYSHKIGAREFEIWMRLLGEIEGSVLWLLKGNDSAYGNLKRHAQAAGIAPDRLVFAEPAPHAEHLARHKLADLFLDTFNYNAHTNASDALWAGLPVLTKTGESFAARVATSLLHAIGLPDLVTGSEDDYEGLALKLASAPSQLTEVKERLAKNRLSMPLFDTTLSVRNLEAAYDQAFALYLSGESPRDLNLNRRFE